MPEGRRGRCSSISTPTTYRSDSSIYRPIRWTLTLSGTV
jgi:hypothetical protein